MLLFYGGGGGGVGGPPPLGRNKRQDGVFGGERVETTTETIALTLAYDNSLWGAAETTTSNSNFNEMNSFSNPAHELVQSNGNDNNNNNSSSSSSLSALATTANNQLEQSFSDWWHEYWSRQPFPSGYTQSSITLLACFISTIIFLIVVGNLLVCIAIFTEKSLKPTQNWFIASLAVSDMLLGLMVMPFSLARELMGFWIFGPLWCDIHEALDVLLSTASINTLCLISLDRYWSITQAVSYLKKRTPRRGALMIAFVWILSAAVSLPPLFGWKKQSPSLQAPALGGANSTQQQQQQQSASGREQARKTPTDSVIAEEGAGEQWDAGQPTTTRKRRRRRRQRRREQTQELEDLEQEEASQFIPSVINNEQQHHHHHQQQQVAYLLEQQQLQVQMQQQQQLATEYPTCQLSDDVGYVLYSAIGSFYIPCAVMVFTYIKIFLAARSRARRAINKQARNQQASVAASAKNKGAGVAGQNQRGPSGGRSATIAGLTKGRASKQQLLMSQGDSSLLLANANSTKLTSAANGGTGDDNNDDEPARGPQDPNDAAHHLHHRHYRHKDSTAGGQTDAAAGMMRGKLVVMDRRKSNVSQPVAAQGARKPDAGQPAPEPNAQQYERTPPADNRDNPCLATLITSGAHQAAAHNFNGGNMNTSVSCDAVTSGEQSQQLRQRKQTNESNDSSLITVMSASMTDLPQVTRFNFAKQQQQQQQTADAAEERDKQKAAQLLRAISRAGHELSEENLVKEIEASAPARDAGETVETVETSEQAEQQQNPPSHSTNETCFMTIEEDSDNFDAQTGRTIMMIASTARQSSGSILASKSAQARAGMMMTMQPAGGGGGESGVGGQGAICTDAACAGRRRRRSVRHGSSYCGSSMTIDDEDEEDEEEEEDELGDDDEDEDDCLEDDDLLTDDCNGYSGSCTLGPYCHTSACAHCGECAAALTDDDDLAHNLNATQHDSPSTCNCKSSMQDSPQLTAKVASAAAASEQRNIKRLATGGRCQCHRHHKQRLQQHQRTCSEGEGQSLTGDDNLSLTDYYRSNEDNSSVVGHDVLDATPAEHHHRNRQPHDNKRRSIVASAIASMGGGLKGMTGGGNQPHANAQLPDEAPVKIVGRKKSSIGFHLARFGGSGAASQSGGGLLALAAAQSQQLGLDPIAQQQQQPAAPRNLKTLRQNFFHKLNQLTAKSAAKQNQQTPTTTTDGGKSSAQSSYGSSYEPSVDYATTSNMPSTNDHYHQETTFGETDVGWQPHHAGDRRQSGARTSKLLTIAQQTAARHQMSPIPPSSDMSLSRLEQQQVSASSVQPNTGNEADVGPMTATGPHSQEAIADGKCNNVKRLNNMDLKQDNNNNNNGDRLALICESDIQAENRGGQAKRRSDGKSTLALVNSNQSNQRSTATSGTSRQGGSSNNNSAGGTSRAYLASDNERHKRKLAKARERRATLILGLIMAAFICSWLPFFTFYVIRAICHVCRDYISPRLEAFIFWLGYCNSAINPIIYTIFNRDFRRAFRKILFKCL